VAEDLIPILTRFHREVMLPDIQRIVGEAVDGLEGRMSAHFDAIYQRFDRLETEYHMLVAGLKRVEERLDRIDRVEGRLDVVEQRLAKQDLQAELAALKARVDGLQGQIRILEERLSA